MERDVTRLIGTVSGAARKRERKGLRGARAAHCALSSGEKRKLGKVRERHFGMTIS